MTIKFRVVEIVLKQKQFFKDFESIGSIKHYLIEIQVNLFTFCSFYTSDKVNTYRAFLRNKYLNIYFKHKYN